MAVEQIHLLKFLPMLRSVVGIVFLICIYSDTSHSEAYTSLTEPNSEVAQKSLGKQWENLGRLYKDEANPILQEVWLLGRYHGQYHWSEGSEGDDNGYETRRFRVGSQVKLFDKLTIHSQMNSGSDISPFFNGFSELWAQWKFSPELALTIGQQKNRFSHDRNVSSRYLNYLERGMLTNMFAAEYTPAITLQGKVGDLSYYSGIFTNESQKDTLDSFTDLNSGYSLLAAAYYNLRDSLLTDSAYLHSTYLHSEANNHSNRMNHFREGFSSALILTEAHLSLVTELIAGLGRLGNGDAVGINIQPGYFLTDSLQIVTRYQLASSNQSTGLTPQKRYEKESGLTQGDLYQAVYFGLNYYLANHRLKLMTGIELALMNGETLWTSNVMIRFYFGPHSNGAFPMNQMLPGHFFDYD